MPCTFKTTVLFLVNSFKGVFSDPNTICDFIETDVGLFTKQLISKLSINIDLMLTSCVYNGVLYCFIHTVKCQPFKQKHETMKFLKNLDNEGTSSAGHSLDRDQGTSVYWPCN